VDEFMRIGGIFIFGAEFAFVACTDVVCLSGEFGGRLVVVSGLVTVALVKEFNVESDESDSKSDSDGIGEGGAWRWRPFL